MRQPWRFFISTEYKCPILTGEDSEILKSSVACQVWKEGEMGQENRSNTVAWQALSSLYTSGLLFGFLPHLPHPSRLVTPLKCWVLYRRFFTESPIAFQGRINCPHTLSMQLPLLPCCSTRHTGLLALQFSLIPSIIRVMGIEWIMEAATSNWLSSHFPCSQL